MAGGGAVADLALLVLTLFWGTTFHFVKGVLEVASPGVFLAGRFATAALVLALAWLVRRDRPGAGPAPGRRPPRPLHARRVRPPDGRAPPHDARALRVPHRALGARRPLRRPVRCSAAACGPRAGRASSSRWPGSPSSPIRSRAGPARAVRLGDALTARLRRRVRAPDRLHVGVVAAPPARPASCSRSSSSPSRGAVLVLPFEAPRLAPGGLAQFAGTVAFTGVAHDRARVLRHELGAAPDDRGPRRAHLLARAGRGGALQPPLRRRAALPHATGRAGRSSSSGSSSGRWAEPSSAARRVTSRRHTLPGSGVPVPEVDRACAARPALARPRPRPSPPPAGRRSRPSRPGPPIARSSR